MAVIVIVYLGIMPKTKPLPSQSALRAAFDYDPETGVLSGSFAGPVGYLQVYFEGRKLYAHRVIWKWMTGEEPEIMDHRNRVRDDNRWSNLRSRSWATNNRNRGLSSRNKSGTKGVIWIPQKQRWKAIIMMNGKAALSRLFVDYDDAVAAVREAREKLHGDEACHG